MQHLSALDALFLYLETTEMPMHVGSLILFEKPKGHRGSFCPNIRAHIASRMHLAPLFSRRLAFMPLDLTNPVWLEAGRVDVDAHIKRLVLPKPGTQAQLHAAVARLHEGMLDRDRPLWEFTVIEGLQSRQVGFYSKIHHAALDGQGGVALAQAVLDTDPAPREVRARDGDPARLKLSTARMLGAAFRNTIAQYGRIVRAVPGVVRLARDAGAAALSASEARRAGAPSEQGSGIPALTGVASGDSLETIARSLLKKIPGGISLGPRTPLNVAISPARAFVGMQIPLAETKAIGRHFGAKLNDVALATCAAALRRMYSGEKKLLSKPMICAVPASLRAAGDTGHGNQVTMMLVNMATHIADPRKRLAAIVASSAKAKAITGVMKSVIPTDMPSLGIPWLMSVITPLYRMAVASNRIPVVANLVVSNVPGPQVPMYMAGAAMRAYFPVSIVVHGLGLNITIVSYNGSMDYGLIACRETLPRLEDFAQYMQDAHRELLDLVAGDVASDVQPAPKPAKTAKLVKSDKSEKTTKTTAKTAKTAKTVKPAKTATSTKTVRTKRG